MRFFTIFVLFYVIPSHAQKPAWLAAPLNFIPDAQRLAAQQVQGDVYSIDDMYYDETGSYLGNAVKGLVLDRNWTEADVNEPDFPGSVRVYNDAGLLTTLTFYKNGVLERRFAYTYNPAGLVLTVTTDGTLSSTYVYDAQNRLIAFKNLDPTNSHTKNFSYKQDGNILKVKQVRIVASGKKEMSELHFKNGLEVYDSAKTYQNHYMFDSHANWISKTYVPTGQQDPVTINRTITYHSERPKAAALTVVKDFKNGDLAKPIYSLQVKGASSDLFKLTHLPALQVVFVYNTITGDYFYAMDKEPTNAAIKTTLPVKGAYVASPFVVIYNENGLFILDQNRVLDNSTIATATLGNARVFYDHSTSSTYIDLDIINNDMAIVPIEKMNSNATAYYVITNEETLVLVDKGVAVLENREAVFKFLENGNPVIVIDGLPRYELPPFQTMTVNIIDAAQPYSGGELFNEPPKK